MRPSLVPLASAASAFTSRAVGAFAAFGAALSFLTRMGVPHLLDEGVLMRSVRWYGAVGAVVGVLCAAPVWAVHRIMSPPAGAAGLWAYAWSYVVLSAWITRGMHWDGLADIGDACGSGAQGERFWEILHDSRVGAFGVMTLCLGFAGMGIAAHGRMALGMWLPLVLAPVFGRCCAVLLAGMVPPRNPHSLGGKVCAGATPAVAVGHILLGIGIVLALPVGDAVATLAGAGIALCVVRRLARQQGGLNGDMLGAVIVGGELAYLLQFS